MSTVRQGEFPRGAHPLLSTGLTLFLCAVFLASSNYVTGDDEGCAEARLDVVVVLDSSGSVGSSNFKRTKEFAASILEHLPVGPDAVRVGVVSYSNRAYIQSYLNEDMDKDSKLKKLRKMKYRPGLTYTDKGLRTVREEILIPSRGDRPDVKELIILTTDGESSDRTATHKQVDLLKKRNDLTILVIGIGKYTSRSEMEYMASTPEMVRHVTSFADLATIVYELSSMSCTASKDVLTTTSPPSTTTSISTKTTSTETTTAKTTQETTSASTTESTQAATTGTTAEQPVASTVSTTPRNDNSTANPNLPAGPSVVEDCSLAKVDVVVILDVSGSQGLGDFRTAKDIVTNILRQLPVDSNAIRVGMVDCSTDTRVHLDENMERDEKLKKVDAMKYGGSSEDVNRCLQIARQDVLTLRHGDRPNVRDFVILITNRKSSDQEAAYLQADLLKTRDQLRVFVIGVGKYVSVKALEYIASSPTMVQHASSLAKLPGAGSSINVFICNAIGSDIADASLAPTSLPLDSKTTENYHAETTSSTSLDTTPGSPLSSTPEETTQTTEPSPSQSFTGTTTDLSSSKSESTSESLQVEQAPEAGKNIDLNNSTASNSHQNATKMEHKRSKSLTLEDVGLMVGAAFAAAILLAISACCVWLCCRKKTPMMKREIEPLRKPNGGMSEYYGE